MLFKWRISMTSNKLFFLLLLFSCFMVNVSCDAGKPWAAHISVPGRIPKFQGGGTIVPRVAIGTTAQDSATATIVKDSIKKTWEQWWSARAISISLNPYSIYKQIIAHPVLAVAGTGISVALGITLYIRYHRNCDCRAQKYQEIFNGIQDDLKVSTTKYQAQVSHIARDILHDTKLIRLIDEFYQTINPATAAGVAAGAAAAPARPSVQAPAITNNQAVVKSSEIQRYLFGGNGNYGI
jgi:hypothetical protein